MFANSMPKGLDRNYTKKLGLNIETSGAPYCPLSIANRSIKIV